MKLERKCRSCKWRGGIELFDERDIKMPFPYPCDHCLHFWAVGDMYEYDETEVED